MRIKCFIQRCLKIGQKSSVKVVNDYRQKYEKLDEILTATPNLLEIAHQDWVKNLSISTQGRSGDFTSEELLRALVVMFVEGCSYRETVVRIHGSETLREFVGLSFKPVMDPSFLCRAYQALSPETWEALNQALGKWAKNQGKIDGEKCRVDSTVVETNIHYPTDASLLWDSAQTLYRLLKACRWEMRQVGLRKRFHLRKIKKRYLFITRHSSSTSRTTQRQVRRTYRQLVRQVDRLAQVAQAVLAQWEDWSLPPLDHYLPLVKRIVQQTRDRVLKGMELPADQKLYSLFEEHTELIMRGKAGKRVEFGHKVLLAQNGEKFITHYRVLAAHEEDVTLLPETLQAHRDLFQENPQVLAGDKGFYKDMKQIDELSRSIPTVAIAKKGRRDAVEEARETSEAFQAGQRFRAGIEGSISSLKRVFKLNRCLFKGMKNFTSSVGCAVFCHNLMVLARM